MHLCIYASSLHILCTHHSIISFFYSLLIHPLSIHLSIHPLSTHPSFCPLFIHLFSVYPSTTHQPTHSCSCLSIPYSYLSIHCSSIHISIHLLVYPLSIFHQTFNYSSIPLPIFISIHIPCITHPLSIHLVPIICSSISPSTGPHIISKQPSFHPSSIYSFCPQILSSVFPVVLSRTIDGKQVTLIICFLY